MTQAAPTRSPSGVGAEAGSAPDDGDVARESIGVALATAASRITGLGKLAAIAAVLGPTYMGNTFQAVNLLPNAVYEFVAGSLLVNLLVPPLVRHISQRNLRDAERLAGGFLGVATLALSAVLGALLLARPYLLSALTAGVRDPVVAAAQRDAASLLLMLVLPQILLYVIAGTGGALLNAKGRPALPAGAPAIENIGVIATVVAAGALFGTGISVEVAPVAFLLVLGIGSTASAALHAAIVWIGCRRDGLRLRMRAGWRDAEVRRVVRDTVPTIGQAGLNALWPIVGLVIANAIAGGVVAFQFALTFSYLPSALGAKAVGASTLRRLAARYHALDDDGFRRELARSFALTAFLAVPAAFAYLVLATPLVRAVSFGEMATPRAVELVAIALMALAPGVIAEAGFLLGTSASFARGDPRAPFRSMAIRGVITVGGMFLAARYVSGPALLLWMGLSVSVGTIIGAVHLIRRLGTLRPPTRELWAPIRRAVVASTVMAVVLLQFIPVLHSGEQRHTSLLLRALFLGGLVYLGSQWMLRGPEFRAFTGLLRRRERPRAEPVSAEPLPAGSARPRARRRKGSAWSVVAVVASAGVLGLAAGAQPMLAVIGVVGIGLFALVLARLRWAAYLLIAVTPLVVGMDRGTVLPLVRPSEGLLLLVAVPLLIRAVIDRLSGTARKLRFHQIDAAILFLAVAGSLIPLLFMLARGQYIAMDDLLYALVLWKYAALYLVMRTAIRTDDELQRCLWLSIAATCVVALIGIMQALRLFGLPELLANWYAADGMEPLLANNRASATIGNPIALADVMAIHVAVAVGWLMRKGPDKMLLRSAAILFCIGAFASGQLSGAIALVIAAISVAVLTHQTRRLVVASIPVAILGLLLLRPVIDARIDKLDPVSRVPQSWISRRDNLRTYFLPQLTSGANIVTGVRPAGRIPAPEPWRQWVYIESGYVWILWVGGVPFLIAFFVYISRGLRLTGRLSRRRSDAVGIAAMGAFSGLAIVAVLMVLDPHLTMRGAADVTFSLLGLAMSGATIAPDPVGTTS